MQIFRPGANTVATLLLASLGVIPVLAIGLAYRIAKSPYVTGQGVIRNQPVPFSHEHHVGGLGIDCRYCHTAVEKARFAGMPPTETCMTCHSQLWTNAAMLAPVRASLAESKPIAWTRVNDLPGYVYFDHSVHIAKGVGCTTCHGPIGQMRLDLAGRALDHAVVPRLPPRSGQGYSAARGGVRSRLEAGGRRRGVRAKADGHLSYPHRSPYGLLDMSPVKELPVKGSQSFGRGPAALSRRQALSLLATGVASGLAGCSKPVEEIIPYVKMPERIVPGEALKFATTLSLSGWGRGVIVTSIDGRPIKVEGNPRHPASLGATDVFAEAAVLSLYDPDRSRTVLKQGAIASPEAFRLALQQQLSPDATARRRGIQAADGARDFTDIVAADRRSVAEVSERQVARLRADRRRKRARRSGACFRKTAAHRAEARQSPRAGRSRRRSARRRPRPDAQRAGFCRAPQPTSGEFFPHLQHRGRADIDRGEGRPSDRAAARADKRDRRCHCPRHGRRHPRAFAASRSCDGPGRTDGGGPVVQPWQRPRAGRADARARNSRARALDQRPDSRRRWIWSKAAVRRKADDPQRWWIWSAICEPARWASSQ